jgi:hypothetical protein
MIKHLFITLCFLFTALPLAAQDEVTMTRWVSPDGQTPLTYDEYRAQDTEARPSALFPVTRARQASGRVLLILVQSPYHTVLKSELNEYMEDIAKEGFSAELYAYMGNPYYDPPSMIRDLLITQYHEVYGSAFAGVLLVGDFPVPWYDLSGDQFPCDLYFMDLDGTFLDQNGDGLFDGHEDGAGDTAPEIFLGRLTVTPITGDNTTLLKDYFQKVHSYRAGAMNVPAKALGFCDDDWAHWGLYGLDRGFTDVTIIDQEDDTTSTNYEDKLDDGYQFIHTMAHSYPGGHHFADSSGGGWTFSSEVKAIDPWALFYNLFACSNCRYVEKDYMGGVYIFCESHGLGAVGCTKSGSMLSFDYFYDPMHRNRSFGDAYREWFETMYPYNASDISWFYGMTLLGDPTLITRPGYYNETPVGPEGFAHYPPIEHPGTGFGRSVVFADLDGDGLEDLIVGAPSAEVSGLKSAGKVIVAYGPDFAVRDEITAVMPAAGERFGEALSVVDGHLAVGVPGRDGTCIDAGAVVIYPSFTVLLPDAPEPDTRFGSSLVSCDLDKNGHMDLAVGGPGGGSCGRVRLFMGPSFTPGHQLQPTTYGPMAEFGSTLATGDLNGDTYPDLLVGAPYAHADKLGGVIVFLGPLFVLPKQPLGLSLSRLDRFGSAAIMTDFDHDGFDDAAITTPGWNGAEGAVHLYKGPGFQYWKTLSAPDVEPFAEFGASLAAFDLDGDAEVDLCVGAPLAEANGVADAGKVYLFRGPDFDAVEVIHDRLPEHDGGFGSVLQAGRLLHDTPSLAVGTPKAGDVQLFGFSLSTEVTSLSWQTGGTVALDLNGGVERAGETYITLMSVTGTIPGVKLSGVAIPLNFDLVTDLSLIYMNTPMFHDFGGNLDAEGCAESAFTLPAGLSAAQGVGLYFAFITFNPIDFASNPVLVSIE